MKKELYLKKSDAMLAAEDYADDVDGVIRMTSVDDRTDFTYKAPDVRNKDWSGETAAVRVCATNGGEDAVFAWWEE